jgi:hypothetical protein
MPSISDLQRSLLTQLQYQLGMLPQAKPPADPLQGYPIGYAQSRRAPTHPPMVVVPDSQWKATDAAYHPGDPVPDQGFTVTANNPALNALNSAFGRSTPESTQAAADFRKGGPTIVVPQSRVNGPTFQHEAGHPLLSGVDTTLPRDQVMSLVQPQSLDALRKAGYDSEDLMKEIPVRLMTEPWTLGMSDEKGKQAGADYADILERNGNKPLADKYRSYYGITPTKTTPQVSSRAPGARDEASFQPPNEVF